MKFIFHITAIIVFSLLNIQNIKSDLPVHCLAKEIEGNTKIKLILHYITIILTLNKSLIT